LGFAALPYADTNMLQQYHKEQAERRGVAKDIIRQQLMLGEKSFNTILSAWLGRGSWLFMAAILH